MPQKPAELLLFEFLTERAEASESGSTLYRLEIHDTIFRSITNECGVRISDAVSDLLPEPGGGLKEFDVELQLVCYAIVKGGDKAHRAEATEKVFEIQQAVSSEIYADGTLGDRVCDSLIERSSRSYDTLDGKAYAVALIPLVINPTGQRYVE